MGILLLFLIINYFLNFLKDILRGVWHMCTSHHLWATVECGTRCPHVRMFPRCACPQSSTPVSVIDWRERSACGATLSTLHSHVASKRSAMQVSRSRNLETIVKKYLMKD